MSLPEALEHAISRPKALWVPTYKTAMGEAFHTCTCKLNWNDNMSHEMIIAFVGEKRNYDTNVDQVIGAPPWQIRLMPMEELERAVLALDICGVIWYEAPDCRNDFRFMHL
jgi:hypothetical protein